jgi:cholesterol oxidase
MKAEYDAVVIGTGFGGAVASCRLAQAKLSVGILERGRRYDGVRAFPRDFEHVERGWLWRHEQGLFDVKPIQEMLVVESAGYGGGSLIYANVHLRPPPDVFASGWPAGYSRAALDPYYDLVAYMLDIKPITEAPAGLPPKTRWMATAAEGLKRGGQFYYPNLAVDFAEPGVVHENKHGVEQAGCTYCGECDIGCNVRAKNTLDMNYLALAERAGADVGTQCEVVRIAQTEGGYVVTYRDHVAGKDLEVKAAAVFVCGGAVNSTELLLRCRNEFGTLAGLSEAVGQKYSGNGDFLAFAFDTATPFDPSVGPTITAALVYDRTQGDVRSWFTLQEGGYPKQIGKLFQLLRPGVGTIRGSSQLLRAELEQDIKEAAKRTGGGEDPLADRSAVFLAMGRDRAKGRIELHPLTRELRIRWDLADNLPLYGAESRLVHDVVAQMKGEPADNPFWEYLKQPVSVHNLGGCPMSDEAATGVVDANGEAFGYPNLFVLDGSILPSATGVNPSHTIAAVAEQNVERFIRKWRKEPGWMAPERARVTPVIDPVDRVQVPAGGTLPTSTPPIGLCFTETMKGFFVDTQTAPLDIADYVALEHEGQKVDNRVSFVLTITMADLDVFLTDSSHTGVAVGRVQAGRYTPADGVAVTTGVFNLFVMSDAPDARRMLYSLPFVGADGEDYLLDGFKDVRDHGHFDVWASTSTLYTVIRRGTTHDAPVCAAGVLHILIPDFIRQLTTFRVLGAGSELERAAAMARFGAMFGGSLWDVFMKPRLAG